MFPCAFANNEKGFFKPGRIYFKQLMLNGLPYAWSHLRALVGSELAGFTFNCFFNKSVVNLWEYYNVSMNDRNKSLFFVYRMFHRKCQLYIKNQPIQVVAAKQKRFSLSASNLEKMEMFLERRL